MAKAKKEKKEKPRQGIQFANGMSGTDVCKAVVADAMEAFDAEAANQVRKERDWRWGYWRHFMKLNALSAKSPEAAIQISRAGLASIAEHFVLAEVDGKDTPLNDAMSAASQQTYHSAEVAGSLPFESVGLTVPIPGKELSGEALLQQMELWVQRGVIEPSAKDAITDLVRNKELLDLRGHHFALLGAASAMGPIQSLLSFGATVHAVELGRPAVVKRMLALVRNSPGRLVLPVDLPAPENPSDEWLEAHAGCDLLSQPAAVASWITAQAPASKLVLGLYVYLDGALFSQVAVAADAIIRTVCSQRGGADSATGVALAYLSSPTEVHCVPAEANKVAQDKGSGLHGLWEQPIRILSKERYLEPNRPLVVKAQDTSAPPLLMQDSVVWQQGPNYCFAKQLQKWRMMVARSDGHVCSATVGPATLTESVMHNKLVAAGMLGCEHFGIEAFQVNTSSSLLAALLIWDVTSGARSSAHPAYPLQSPLQLLQQNACHGGTWRAAFKTNSYTEVSALLYFLGQARPALLLSGAVVGFAVHRRRGRARL